MSRSNLGCRRDHARLPHESYQQVHEAPGALVTTVVVVAAAARRLQASLTLSLISAAGRLQAAGPPGSSTRRRADEGRTGLIPAPGGRVVSCSC